MSAEIDIQIGNSIVGRETGPVNGGRYRIQAIDLGRGGLGWLESRPDFEAKA
jgi:hypothetical protein